MFSGREKDFKMIEEIIEVKKALKENRPLEEVIKKFTAYCIAYDNSEKNVCDKINHRDIFYDYMRYLNKSGNNNK